MTDWMMSVIGLEGDGGVDLERVSVGTGRFDEAFADESANGHLDERVTPIALRVLDAVLTDCGDEVVHIRDTVHGDEPKDGAIERVLDGLGLGHCGCGLLDGCRG